MRDFARTCGTAGMQGVANRDWALAGLALECFRQAELGNEPANLAIPKVKRCERSAAEFGRGLQNRRRREVQIERRTADDFQHLCRGRLLLQRFLQILRPRLHLVEQAHVLDGDDRLVGEGLQQLDVMRGERARLPAGDADDPDRERSCSSAARTPRCESRARPSSRLPGGTLTASVSGNWYGLAITDNREWRKVGQRPGK